MKSIRYYFHICLAIALALLMACKNDEGAEMPTGFEDDGQLYFPDSQSWETVLPDEIGWRSDALPPLLEYLENTNTKAFILLKNGRLVVEAYFGDTQATDNLPWFSAGKTLTAVLAGNAIKEELIDPDLASSEYLGTGWSSLSTDEEENIKVLHHLSMTTGLDDGLTDPFCTEASCLVKLTESGTRWAYHNGSYTLVSNMLENVTNTSYNDLTRAMITSDIGMNGSWVDVGYNRIYFSTARSMARFGLLLLAETSWNQNGPLVHEEYFEQMTSSSQDLNPAYGYLTWLNGKSQFKIPGSQIDFSGMMTPSAPADMYAAMGRDGQLINIVPDMGLVMIRMGDAPGDDLVPFTYQEELWSKLNSLF